MNTAFTVQSHLKYSSSEQGFIQSHGHPHRLSIRELDVCKPKKKSRATSTQAMADTLTQANRNLPSPFRMASEFVTQNSDPVHVTTAVEVDLQLICSRPIIHLCPIKTKRSVFIKNLNLRDFLRHGLSVKLLWCNLVLAKIKKK